MALASPFKPRKILTLSGKASRFLVYEIKKYAGTKAGVRDGSTFKRDYRYSAFTVPQSVVSVAVESSTSSR